MKIWPGQFPVAIGVGISLLLCGCNKPSPESGASSDVIKVGEYASLTGSEATFGQSSHKGTALAVDDINAAGGVLGKKIQLITEDDQSQAGQPATVVRKLISSDGVVAILGEVASSRSLEAAPICQENKIPMISPVVHESESHRSGRLHFPGVFHRSVSRHGHGEFCAQDAQAENRWRC